MRCLLFVLLIGVVCAVELIKSDLPAPENIRDEDIPHVFDLFIQVFKKGYMKGSDEYAKRLELFTQKVKYLRDFNNDKSKTYKLEINHLTDYTAEELGRMKMKLDTHKRPRPAFAVGIPGNPDA